MAQFKTQDNQEKKGKEEKKFKIDGNAIVSPSNTRRIYKQKLDQDEPRPGDSEEINTEIPEDIEYVKENMFPSE